MPAYCLVACSASVSHSSMLVLASAAAHSVADEDASSLVPVSRIANKPPTYSVIQHPVEPQPAPDVTEQAVLQGSKPIEVEYINTATHARLRRATLGLPSQPVQPSKGWCTDEPAGTPELSPVVTLQYAIQGSSGPQPTY